MLAIEEQIVLYFWSDKKKFWVALYTTHSFSHLPKLYWTMYLCMCVCMSVIMCVVQGEMVKTPTVPPFNLPHTICQSFLLSNTEGIHITTHTHAHIHTGLKQTWLRLILRSHMRVPWSPLWDPDVTHCNLLSYSHAEQSGRSGLPVPLSLQLNWMSWCLYSSSSSVSCSLALFLDSRHLNSQWNHYKIHSWGIFWGAFFFPPNNNIVRESTPASSFCTNQSFSSSFSPWVALQALWSCLSLFSRPLTSAFFSFNLLWIDF